MQAAGSSKCSPSGESGGREANTSQQIDIKNKGCSSNSSVTSRVDQGIRDNCNRVTQITDTMKQTMSPLPSHNQLEDRISSSNTPEAEEAVCASKDKKLSTLTSQETHKINEVAITLSNHGTLEMDNFKNTCKFAKEVTNVCDNNITENKDEKTVIKLHSVNTDVPKTNSSLGSQLVKSELVALQHKGSSDICVNCSKDINVPSINSLDAGIGSEITDSKPASKLAKCNCNGNLDRKQFDLSKSILCDRTSRKEMSSDKSIGESCQDTKIEPAEYLPDGSDLSVRSCGASIIPEVVSAEKSLLGIEEKSMNTGSGMKLKRQHCDIEEVEGKQVYEEESSKKLRLEDT